MLHPDGLKVALTGASGFIGQAVVNRIVGGALGQVEELRLNDIRAIERPGAVFIEGSFTESAVRDRLIGDGVDVLFHLASLPGGASERDPVLGKSVNLDGTMALFDHAGLRGCPIIVYTSSIAALGRPLDRVTDATALRPSGSYGTHKAMIEFYLADLTRRGLVDGRAVRPAGIVARPRTAYAGFATAWMSDLFHAALDNRAITIPAPADTQIWLQSIDTLADNIIHAAMLPAQGLPANRVWTLPATVVNVAALIAALSRRTGQPMTVEFGAEAANASGGNPALDACSALAFGFKSDGDTAELVDAVLSGIEEE